MIFTGSGSDFPDYFESGSDYGKIPDQDSTFYFSLNTVVYLFISNLVPNPALEKFRIRLRKSFGSDLG